MSRDSLDTKHVSRGSIAATTCQKLTAYATVLVYAIVHTNDSSPELYVPANDCK